MNNYDKLINYMKKHNGYITVVEVNELKIHREFLRKMIEKGLIEKVDRGTYILMDTFDDDLLSTQNRFKKGIYSHGTALYLHQLTDRTPLQYTMTFPINYNITNVKKVGVNTYRTSDMFYSKYIDRVKTSNGNIVKVYSIEKTLCDIVRGNSKLDIEQVTTAFKVYAKSKHKKVSDLYKIAKILKVEEKVRKYMEVLL
ncbi:MAG: type IV toxin-antitoxin system AbiEi family antitoxin domain-containing protein [Candidatus Izemoplasma sp.]